MDERLKKIMFRTKYRINETPNYRMLNNQDFDEMPDNNYMTQDGMPTPNIPSSDAYIEEDNDAIENSDNLSDMGDVSGEQNVDNDQDNSNPDDNVNTEPELNPDNNINSEELETEKDINKIQNDIIKHNINATKLLQDKIDSLFSLYNNMSNDMKSQLQSLNDKVKEVEEPTNAEKLMSKKDDSYPYYFNLNDLWDENWFEKKHKNKNGVDGIVKLPDGTYVANFDDIDINNDDSGEFY